MDTTSNTQGVSLQRATSRASARSARSGRSATSRASSMSRHNELVRKNIELHDLKPADVLIERFVAWKAIVKQLGAYFEGIADIENNTAKELTKLAGVIQVPFRAGNQFLGEGGLQDVYFDIRSKTRMIADQHADLGRTIDSSIVQHLNKLRAEVKAHIKNVQNDTAKLAASVAREREVSTRLVGELANAISTYKNTPMGVRARGDPYIANQAVHKQLQRQVLEENLLQKSIVMMQQNSAHFEEGIVKAIQSAWATYDEWKSRAVSNAASIHSTIGAQLRTLAPDQEWIQFAARSPHLLHPDTPLRDPSLITYPLKDDPSVVPVHTGYLERKSRWTRAWTEGYYVLTPAGFLHGYASSDDVKNGVRSSGGTAAGGVAPTPTFSLFLPQCTLGPYAGPRAGQFKFSVEGRKDGTGTTPAKSGGTLKSLFAPGGATGGSGGGEGGTAKAWSFRARSREEMMEWWNDMRMLCARYLVASEQVDRTGPVEEAVRAVGYLSGDEEDLSDEEEEEYLEGEGEEQEDEGEDAYVVEGVNAHHQQQQPHHGPGVGIGGGGGNAHRDAHMDPEGLGAPVVDRAQAPAQGRPLSLGATQDYDHEYPEGQGHHAPHAHAPGHVHGAHDHGHDHAHNLPGHLHEEDGDGDGSSVELEDHQVEPPVYQHTGPQTDSGPGAATSPQTQSQTHSSTSGAGGGGGVFAYAKSLIGAGGEKTQAHDLAAASPRSHNGDGNGGMTTAQGYPNEKAVYKAQGYDVGDTGVGAGTGMDKGAGYGGGVGGGAPPPITPTATATTTTASAGIPPPVPPAAPAPAQGVTGKLAGWWPGSKKASAPPPPPPAGKAPPVADKAPTAKPPSYSDTKAPVTVAPGDAGAKTAIDKQGTTAQGRPPTPPAAIALDFSSASGKGVHALAAQGKETENEKPLSGTGASPTLTRTKSAASASVSVSSTPPPLPLPLPLPVPIQTSKSTGSPGAVGLGLGAGAGTSPPSALKRVVSDPSARRAGPQGQQAFPTSISPSTSPGKTGAGGAYPFGPYLARARTPSTPLTPSALGTHAYAAPALSVDHAQGEVKVKDDLSSKSLNARGGKENHQKPQEQEQRQRQGEKEKDSNRAPVSPVMLQSLDAPRGLDRLAGKKRNGDTGEGGVAQLKAPAFTGKPTMMRGDTRHSEHVHVEMGDWDERGKGAGASEGEGDRASIDAETQKHLAQQPSVEEVPEDEEDEEISNAIREWSVTLNDPSAKNAAAPPPGPALLEDEKDTSTAPSAAVHRPVGPAEAAAGEASATAAGVERQERPPMKRTESNKSNKKKKKKGGRK